MSRHVRFALNLWPAVFGALLVFGLMKIEHWFFPVVESFSVVSVDREFDGVTLKGHMIKSRNCEFIGISAVGNAGGRIALRFMDDDSPGTFSRPTGSQNWGPWKVFIPYAPLVSTIVMTAAHTCHPFWTTRTELITLTINGR